MNLPDYLVFIILIAGIYALFALGLNLQWGYAGLLNFGHVAFMAIGGGSVVPCSAGRRGLARLKRLIRNQQFMGSNPIGDF